MVLTCDPLMPGDGQLIFPVLVAMRMSSLQKCLCRSCATLIGLFVFLSLGCKNSFYIRCTLLIRYKICKKFLPLFGWSSHFLTGSLEVQNLLFMYLFILERGEVGEGQSVRES